MNKKLESEQTARRIRESFTNLLLEKDYDKITVKEIADGAGISRTTFYLFYDDKASLAKATYSIFMEGLSDKLIPPLEEYNEDALVETFEYIYSNKQIILGLWQMHEEELDPFFTMLEFFTSRIRADVAKARKQPLSTQDEYFCSLGTMNAMFTLRWWLTQPEKIPARTVIGYMHSVLRSGLQSLLDE